MILPASNKIRQPIKQTKLRRQVTRGVESRIQDIYNSCETLQTNLIKMDKKYTQSNKRLHKLYKKLDNNLDKVRNSSFPPAELILL